VHPDELTPTYWATQSAIVVEARSSNEIQFAKAKGQSAVNSMMNRIRVFAPKPRKSYEFMLTFASIPVEGAPDRR